MIKSILKQAITTFTCKSEVFSANLEILKTLLEKTTAEDVNLPAKFMTQRLWEQPTKAPVTYIDIFENPVLTIGIFILKPGMKLPLHNHPQMYGLIKVIAGTVKITSYSINTPKTKEVEQLDSLASFKHLQRATFAAELCAQVLVSPDSDCCVLEPEYNNIHEIESVNGPAAFIDILSPPYETQIANNGFRKCSYYSVLHEIAPDVYKLKEVNSPSWYWTDSSQYEGPDIENVMI